MRSILLHLLVGAGVLLALPAGASAAAPGTLSVSISGAGAVEGGGIHCSRTVDDNQPDGVCGVEIPDTCPVRGCTPGITLTARPERGFAFEGWAGGCTGKEDTCTVTGPDDVRVGAAFRDVEPPNVALPAPITGVVSGTIPVSATASDNVIINRVQFRVRGELKLTDTTAPYGGDFTTSTVPDGPAAISATAFDRAGNSRTATVNVVIDNTAPKLAVTGPDRQPFRPGAPPSWQIAASDLGSGVTHLGCSVVAFGDAPAFSPCPSATAFTAPALPEGRYTFTIRAVDGTGRFTQTGRDFRIDATAPNTRMASGIPNGASTRETSLRWTLEATEPATFECRVYPAAVTPGPFGPCSAPLAHAASGFVPGTYSIEVRAVDVAGNIDPSPAKRTFTIAPPPAAATPAFTPAAASAATSSKAKDAPPQIVVTLGFSFTSTQRATKLSRLVVKNVPPGSTVTLKCPKGCKKKVFRKTKARGQVSLAPLMKKALRVNTEITVIVSRPGASSAIKILKIRARKAPLVTTLCQPEDAPKPLPC